MLRTNASNNFFTYLSTKTRCRWGNNVVCGGIKIECATCKLNNGICNVVIGTYLIICGINDIAFGKTILILAYTTLYMAK